MEEEKLKQTLMTLIGNNVRQCRMERGLTQEELANMVEVDPSTIARIKGGSQMNEYLESSRRGRVRACSTRQFPSPQLLASCAGLVPSNDESAGAVKSRSILPGNPHLKVILCQAAWIAVRSRTIPFSVT